MKGTFFVSDSDDVLLNNRVFLNEALLGMKSDNYMYIRLKEVLNEKGISLDTQDILPPEEADFIICQNVTTFFKTYQRSKKNKFIYLILSEPPVYNSHDWAPENHKNFDKVFTYNIDLVDNIKYFKYTFPIDFIQVEEFNIDNERGFNEKKHCCMVAAAISIVPHKNDLQSLLYERYKAIKWFNNNAPQDLDLYARKHPVNFCKSFKGASILERISPRFREMIATSFFNKTIKNVYKGSIPANMKLNYLNRYKFSICFENTVGMKGLISEKIFDCFMSMNIPVYYGASDIDTCIPKSCFIDFRDFNSYKELNDFLHSISWEQYSDYQKAIKKFLNSSQITPFTVDSFANLFVNHINTDLAV